MWVGLSVAPLSVTNGSKKLLFSYDYMGRRVRKDVLQWNGSIWQTNEIRSFSYDGWNMICERVTCNPSPVTNYYTWGLDLSGSLQGAGGIGGLVSAQLTKSPTNNPTTVFYTFDGNGNVSECVTPAGEVVVILRASPVGAVVVSEGTFAEVNPWKFSTKYFDLETLLGYWGMRWYSAEINRWASRDPMGAHMEPLYPFCGNSCVGHIDPLGMVFVAVGTSRRSGDREDGWTILGRTTSSTPTVIMVVLSDPVRCPKDKCWRLIYFETTMTVDYWWVQGNQAVEDHEKQHVANYHSAYRSIDEYADGVQGCYKTQAKAECWMGVARTFSALTYYSLAEWQNAIMDIAEPGGSVAARDYRNAYQGWSALFDAEKQRCSAL